MDQTRQIARAAEIAIRFWEQVRVSDRIRSEALRTFAAPTRRADVRHD